MRFQLHLAAAAPRQKISYNYPYALSSAIYKILQTADNAYADFLHNTGYQKDGKRFKLFTFSQLQTPFESQSDHFILKTEKATLQICFFLPNVAETFIKGLFLHRDLELGDAKFRARFIIEQVETLDDGLTAMETNGVVRLVLHPLSPIVTGRKNDRGHYIFLHPADPQFCHSLSFNLALRMMKKRIAAVGFN